MQGRLATLELAFLLTQRLPLRRAHAAERTAGRQADGPQAGVEARLQQARFSADQHAAVQAADIQGHQRLPAGIGSRPAGACVGGGGDPVG